MNDWPQLVIDSATHAIDMAREGISATLSCYQAPSAIFRPKIYIDGNKWCALYGDDLQNGVAGFGDSPDEAMWDFDRNWTKKLKQPTKD